MICLGLSIEQKQERIATWVAKRRIERIVILSPAKFFLPLPGLAVDLVEYAEIIQYKTFYRLLQEIDDFTLLIINECLRTQHRSDLTFNCIRHFLNQTSQQLIFQYLPLIDVRDNFMTLLDWDTRSRWKCEPFNPALFSEAEIEVQRVAPILEQMSIETDQKTRLLYDKTKRRLFADLGGRDPHTLPRNLYLIGGGLKRNYILNRDLGADIWYIGRNNRFGLERLQTFREEEYPHCYIVFEFPHNFIQFADFLTLTAQMEFAVICADLKVDHWYWDRYTEWVGRINDCYAALQQT